MITSPATGSLVSRSRVALNRADGINLDTGIVMDTTSNANVLNGIACGRLCRLENNVAVFNPMSGIVVGRGSNVSRNTIDGNGADGIRVTGASAIIENTARSNGGDGIDCTGGGKSSVRDNTSVENAGIGLNLSDLAIQDPVYRGNAVVDNTSATVSGGNNVGDNTCIALGIVSTCP